VEHVSLPEKHLDERVKNKINTTDGRMRKKIWMATFNIQNGRQGNLESAWRALKMMNIDIGILEETKIVNEFYTRKTFGY
jgi:hypothetical protein